MKLTNDFATHLGTSFAVCIRDQFRYVFKEFAHCSGYRLPFLGIFFVQETARFRYILAAHLEAVAVMAMLDREPETRKDEKFVKKVAFQTQGMTEAFLSKKFFGKLEPDQVKEYQEIKRRFMLLAQQPDTTNADLADYFLKVFHGESSKSINDTTRYDMMKETGMAAKTFRSIYDLAAKNHGLYGKENPGKGANQEK